MSVEEFVAALSLENLPKEQQLDLICAEMLERADRGEELDPQDYLRRFPQFRMELIRMHSVFHGLVADSGPLPPALVETRVLSSPGPARPSPPASGRFGKYQLLENSGRGAGRGLSSVRRQPRPGCRAQDPERGRGGPDARQ
ncbi:MAG: hypothetical protein QM713_17725 [Arachnia sp.]